MLGKHKAAHGSQAKQVRVEQKCFGESGQQPSAQQRDEGAAGAVAQQRHAYHHIGEVVPLYYREQADQQHFIGKRRRRDEKNRIDRRAVELSALDSVCRSVHDSG